MNHSKLIVIASLQLTRDEIPLIWSIDRSKVIEAVYVLEDGALTLFALEPEDIHLECSV